MHHCYDVASHPALLDQLQLLYQKKHEPKHTKRSTNVELTYQVCVLMSYIIICLRMLKLFHENVVVN